jgi:hypothetical protein
MEKRTLNKKWLASVVLLISLIASVVFFVQSRPTIAPVVIPINPPQQQTQVSVITYQGESGKDALTLLKEKATIEQDKSSMVTVINGRKADTGRHEYWAFYINGKSASVGPADYQTQAADTIQWKIDKY